MVQQRIMKWPSTYPPYNIHHGECYISLAHPLPVTICFPMKTGICAVCKMCRLPLKRRARMYCEGSFIIKSRGWQLKTHCMQNFYDFSHEKWKYWFLWWTQLIHDDAWWVGAITPLPPHTHPSLPPPPLNNNSRCFASLPSPLINDHPLTRTRYFSNASSSGCTVQRGVKL
jgi:hypothetical protein